MNLDLLNNYVMPLVINKSTSSFTVTFIGFVVFCSGVIAALTSISAFFKALAVKDNRGTYTGVWTGVLSVIVAILAITQTGFIKNISTQNSRLEELCQSAELKVYKINESDISSIYTDRDHTVQFDGGYGSFGSLGNPLLYQLTSYEMKNPEYKVENGLKYLRVTKVGKEEINEIQSEFSVLNTDISSKEDKYIGIFGSDIRVINNKNNEVLAHLRYFWNSHNHRKFCPSTSNRLVPSQTIMYVLGMDMHEEVKLRVIEGLTR